MCTLPSHKLITQPSPILFNHVDAGSQAAVQQRQYGTLGRAPTKEQPPPYHILPRSLSLSLSLSSSSFSSSSYHIHPRSLSLSKNLKPAHVFKGQRFSKKNAPLWNWRPQDHIQSRLRVDIADIYFQWRIDVGQHFVLNKEVAPTADCKSEPSCGRDCWQAQEIALEKCWTLPTSRNGKKC